MRYRTKFYQLFSGRACIGLAVALTLTVALPACTTNQTPSARQTSGSTVVATTPETYAFKKGQLLSFISVVSKDTPEAKKALREYYANAFPLASKYGLKREGQLLIKGVPVGDHKSEGVVIYSWPDKASENKLESEAAWPAIKATRPTAWEELRIYTKELDEDLTLSFDPNKTYTLAMAWSNPENPDHYDLYMDGIKDSVPQVGGRFLYKMFDPKFESNQIKDGGPSQVTLVEWDTVDGLKNFGETEGFKRNAHYLKSGVTRFEILALGTS